MNESRLKCRAPGERHPNWEALYQGTDPKTMPWHFEPLDPDLIRALDERKISSGTLLDIGTGTGAQAFELGKRGFDVTGSDLSPSAIERARRSYPNIHYQVDDILDSSLVGPFQFIFDRGCFHVLPETAQHRFAKVVTDLLVSKGRLFLKCFSTLQPEMGFGPLRFSKESLREVFGRLLEEEEIIECRFQGSMPHAPQALFAIFRKGAAQ